MTNATPTTDLYDIRQPGMTSYATAATLDQARDLLAEARSKGIRAACYVQGRDVAHLLDGDIAYEIVRLLGAASEEGSDEETIALCLRATDGRGYGAYGAEGAGLSDDEAAIAECMYHLALCAEMDDEGDED